MEETQKKGRMVIAKKLSEFMGNDFFDTEFQKAVHANAPCMVLMRDEKGQVENIIIVEE